MSPTAATEVISFLVLGIGYWLFDAIPWIVIAFAMVLLPRWLGARGGIVVSVLLGTAVGLAVMCCINGCSYPGHASFGIAAFWAVSDAIIEAVVLTVLFRLARRSFERDRLK